MTSAKTAVVTGAGSGIGRATALALNTAGYNVVLAGRRKDELDKTAGMAGSGSGRMVVVPTDVADRAQVANLFAQTKKEFGRLDLLFNNAGIGAPQIPMEDLSFEQWKQVVDINLTGSFLCAQEAVRIMKAQTPKGGRIINNGSISAHAPRLFSVPYTSTKHAVHGLTKALSIEARKHDIACCQIDVGNADTPMGGRVRHGTLQADGETRPEPVMDVKHVASAVVYMASLPLDANVQFMTVMATKMPFLGRG